MNFFNSKAETIEALSKLSLKNSKVLPFVYFTYEEWQSNQLICLDRIHNLKIKGSYIVRSSSKTEDRIDSSNAGAFLSLPNVAEKDLKLAIKRVFESYGKPSLVDQVLIQSYLTDVVTSGVAFSHDPKTCAPYRVVSWSNKGDTDIITKGNKGGKTLFSHSSYNFSESPDLKGLFPLLLELELLFQEKPIDIEFAFSESKGRKTLWLLQLRPLIIKQKQISRTLHAQKITRIENYLNESMRPKPFLKGRTTAFGIMPDWNPAEIIGLRPRPLAKSLYRDLITDSIWSYQRNNYGYRNLRGFPLMVELEGLPYIDTRVSFNSFIPYDISDNLAEKLVDYYQGILAEKPFLHDKIEFDIVYSCYTLDLKERLKKLPPKSFSRNDLDQIRRSLLSLTNKILNPNDGLMVSDSKHVETLKMRRDTVLKSEMSLVSKVYWLLEDGKLYGTLPFAGLARAGFIAVQLLNSLVTKGILSTQESHNFLSSIRTVTSNMSEDLYSMEVNDFLRTYGHLRPGTYDILSPRYDEQPELYFDFQSSKVFQPHSPTFRLSIAQIKSVEAHLAECELNITAIEFFSFIEKAIKLRERSKFEFTKNLSETLRLIGELGVENGFSLSDLSYANINDIKTLHASTEDPKDCIKRSIDKGRNDFFDSSYICLPSLITKPNQIWQFTQADATPNYITQKIITAPIADLLKKSTLEGAIVCISSADPGYDWVFSQSIGGLVTEWGGANSHMAIRASEMGVPAIIGAGEKVFNEIQLASYIRIDCESKLYKVIR